MIFVQSKTQWMKGCLDLLNVRQRDDQVEILVLAGLAPEERINAPATIEHGFDTRGTQDIEQHEYSLGGHRLLLGEV
jgi:hypothetical protein